MIIKGDRSASVRYWSTYLMDPGDNDHVELIKTINVLAQDLRDAVREMQVVASGSRCHGKFMYVASINPHPNDHFSSAQWLEPFRLLGIIWHRSSLFLSQPQAKQASSSISTPQYFMDRFCQ